MTDISALAVKELRRRSGAGMMDCKSALQEAAGDMDKAAHILRARGQASAVKKSGRTASQGGIALVCDGQSGAMLELNCETDFVARNKQFLQLADGLAPLVLAQTNGALAPEKLTALPWPHEGGEKVSDALQIAVSGLGENLVLRRATRMELSAPGLMASYVHNSLSPRDAATQCGQIAVLVALHTSLAPDHEGVRKLGRQLAMHIAANAPVAVTKDRVDESLLQRERAVYRAEAQNQGKADDLLERIVEGRVRKFLAASVLMQQPFVMDSERSVQMLLQDEAKALGADVSVAGFMRWMLGEESEAA